jgi:hypothetical protein
VFKGTAILLFYCQYLWLFFDVGNMLLPCTCWFICNVRSYIRLLGMVHVCVYSIFAYLIFLMVLLVHSFSLVCYVAVVDIFFLYE